MAHTSDSEEKLNVELNIVPFIDLLSTLVLFLLVTAVWIQIGAIPASVDSKGKSNNRFSEDTRLTIRLTSKGYVLHWPKGLSGVLQIPTVSGKYNQEVLLSELKNAVKKKNLSHVAVQSDEDVEYGLVAETIDIVKQGDVSQVALSTE